MSCFLFRRKIFIWCLLIISTPGSVVYCSNPVFDTTVARQIIRLAKSAEMRNYMNQEVDACENFYQYACGNWAKINPAINEVKTNIITTNLYKAYDRRLLNILDELKISGDVEINRKVKYFYESCLQSYPLPQNYRENLLRIMDEFGGMPAVKGLSWKESDFNWLKVIAQILRKYGRKIILGVDIKADLTNNRINRVYIGQHDDLVMGKSNKFYSQLIMTWSIMMQKILGLDCIEAIDVAFEIVNFFRKLASGMVNHADGIGMEDKTRLRLLDEMTENYGPNINFTEFVNTWLGYEYRRPVYEYVENYIRNLRILIMETPPRIVANYIMWELIYDFYLDAQPTLNKQKKKCIEITKKHFPKYLDHLIYKQIVSQQPDVIDEVNSLWQQLKLSFRDILLSSSTNWMSESTRDKALEKLSAMSFEINSYMGVDFKTEFSSLTISSEDFFENLVNIFLLRGRNFRMKIEEPPKFEKYNMLSFTSFYVTELNRVILPVSFLQPRYLWDDLYPKALKYGTVGYIIAHEIAHGFNDINRKYDAKGNLNNWWDRNASAEFATRKECLRQQYGQYSFNGKLLPKFQNQDNNIASNIGIHIAYAAYEMWLSKHHHTPEHLPHMDTINARQLFFISLAQIWCTDINPMWYNIVDAAYTYPPEEIRVRAGFANINAFAEAFHCELGSQMHPYRKCNIF